ncbi:hypothetical protein CDAR_548101 [Caerostris darwini]|uniref:Uncharacterized protein n=1 Tax=Caerostris darwini TaxID=1538125 RepID=A0AAV4WH65_9ARAC|nr:hypothetical protein CDAR_548101 [Caerostris darwini]
MAVDRTWGRSRGEADATREAGCVQAKRIELGVRPDIGPGTMETVEDEWWRRMESVETIDYSVRASAPGASNPELMDTTRASIPSELLSSPINHETLSEEERCARISTVTKKKDLAQNLYDAYAAALTGYSPDDDDLKVLKKHHDDLQLAMRERQDGIFGVARSLCLAGFLAANEARDLKPGGD